MEQGPILKLSFKKKINAEADREPRELKETTPELDVLPVERQKLRLKLKRHNLDRLQKQEIMRISESDETYDSTGGLKLKLVRKDRNSPILSIQKFIYQQLKSEQQISDLRKLWSKYEKMSIHSLIIKHHELDYEIFRQITEEILETFEPYQVEIRPIYCPDIKRISNQDLVDRVV